MTLDEKYSLLIEFIKSEALDVELQFFLERKIEQECKRKVNQLLKELLKENQEEEEVL